MWVVRYRNRIPHTSLLLVVLLLPEEKVETQGEVAFVR